MESKIVDNYESVTLHQSLLISKLFTVHYFEYMNDFSFPGEAHNFWEFLCVDKGEVDVVAGSRSLSPVSYTHLDVYKRQVSSPTSPFPKSRLQA